MSEFARVCWGTARASGERGGMTHAYALPIDMLMKGSPKMTDELGRAWKPPYASD